MIEQIGIRNGVYGGMAVVVFVYLIYFIRPQLLFHWIGQGRILIVFVFMLLASHQYVRRTNDTSFKGSLKMTFLVVVIANLFYFINDIVLFNVIQPDLVTIEKQSMIEKVSQLSNFLGEERSEELIDRYQDANYTHSVPQNTGNYVFGLIPGFLLACLASLFRPKTPQQIT